MRIVDPLTDPLFAKLSTAFPEATPFHGAPWAQTLIRAYGHRPFYQLVETTAPAYRTQEPGTIGDGRPEIGVRSSKFEVRSSKLDSMEAGTRTPNGRPHGPAAGALANAPSPHLPSSISVPPTHRPTVSPPLRPSALLPLMEVSSWLTGRRGVALPFSDVCPLLSSEASNTPHQEQYLESLWPDLVELGQKRSWRAIELRGGPAPTPEAQPCATFHGHELELGGGESALFNGLHPSVRRAIRKAQQSGLRVELTHTLDALHAYYSLHTGTRQRHGLPPQPFRFFLSLYDEMIANGNAFITLVRLGLRAIAGAIFLHAGRAAVYKYGASDFAHQSLRANDLLFWETIRQLAADGFTVLHFGRTDLGHEGLRRFKLGWGTRETTINYYRYDLRANRFVTVSDRVQGWHNTIFGRLPLPINRIVGAILYRHMH